MSKNVPTQPQQRLLYMDVLRGFAVMAIFVVNIKGMFAPYQYYFNPTLWPGEHDQWIATAQAFIIDNKWRTIFTALFGAGLVLVHERTQAAGADAAQRLQRRLSWLLLFGLVHMFGIWAGDILTLYALTGFFALPFLDSALPKLTKWAMVFLGIFIVWTGLLSIPLPFAPDVGEMASEIMWGTDPQALQDERDAYQGNILAQAENRLVAGLFTLIALYALSGFWALTLATMLGGMALFKSGFLTGQLSFKHYLVFAMLGLSSSALADFFIQSYMVRADWTASAHTLMELPILLAGLPGAFGYAALIGALLKTGLLFSPVAAVGRMAFTNYIACSLIGTTIANGHGGGYFGTLTLQQLMVIVATTFIAMLIWSPLWLHLFRFGPIEWLWRSLTYQKTQPFIK